MQSEEFQDKNILKFHVDSEHYELVYNRTTGNRAILLNLITSIVFTNEHFWENFCSRTPKHSNSCLWLCPREVRFFSNPAGIKISNFSEIALVVVLWRSKNYTHIHIWNWALNKLSINTKIKMYYFLVNLNFCKVTT